MFSSKSFSTKSLSPKSWRFDETAPIIVQSGGGYSVSRRRAEFEQEEQQEALEIVEILTMLAACGVLD